MSDSVVIVEDDPAVLDVLERSLTQAGHRVTGMDEAEKALARFSELSPDLVISDIRLPGMSGLDLLDRVRERHPTTVVLILTGHEDMESAVRAMKAGAYDYLSKPVDLEELQAVVERGLKDARRKRNLAKLGEEGVERALSERLLGSSSAMLEVYKLIGSVADTDVPVLVRGETGTGKELVARAIHDHSSRSHQPLVPVNCSAMPEPLLESELFGHVRGAFTGAVEDRRGRFELASPGTILLDEIAETTPSFQAKLLRVLQSSEFYRVGGEDLLHTDARIIASTNRDLEAAVRDGTFREDLYFRLKVVEIPVPPLRERVEDVPVLAQHFVERAAARMNREVRTIPDEVMRILKAHPWPGNVRELEHAVSRAVLLAPGPEIRAGDLHLEDPNGSGVPGSDPGEKGSAGSEDDLTLEAAIRRHALAVYRRTGENKRKTARLLDISRARLDRILDSTGA